MVKREEGIIDLLSGMGKKSKRKVVKRRVRTRWCKGCSVKLGKGMVQFKDGWYCSDCSRRRKVRK